MKKIISLIAALSGFFIAQNANATCDNYYDFTDGVTLTASQLDGLQTNYTNCINDVLNGDTFTGSINIHSAGDLSIYSDAGTTLKASIDGATGAFIGGVLTPGQVVNCGISVSGSTLSITDSSGAALSSSNPCIVATRGNTSGLTELVYFTSNVTVTFGAASNTDGNLFGLSAADWSSAMPFFLGVVTDGTNKYFTISRSPRVSTGSAAADMCQKDDVDCDADPDVMILTTGLTLASWTSKPITQVGWFTATYTTATTSWTFALSSQSGFNSNFESVEFTFPRGQMGARSSEFLTEGGGSTTPTWATPASEIYRYRVTKGGLVYVQFSTRDAGNCTNGGGTGAVRIHLPYVQQAPSSSTASYYVSGSYFASAATTTSGVLIGGYLDSTSYISLNEALLTNLSANEFNAVSDDITASFWFQIE